MNPRTAPPNPPSDAPPGPPAQAVAGGSTRVVPATAWRKCVRLADYARKNSPRVAALLRRLEGAQCSLSADPIVCEDMFQGAPLVGAYDSVRRLIVMNPAVPESAMNQPEWTRTITHELIHAWDYCRAEIEPGNCRHIACTEVRAANLSGDCDVGAELGRGGIRDFTIRGHQQRCVRRRAELSLSAHPQCVSSRRGAKATVDDVYTPCYADVSPFATN